MEIFLWETIARERDAQRRTQRSNEGGPTDLSKTSRSWREMINIRVPSLRGKQQQFKRTTAGAENHVFVRGCYMLIYDDFSYIYGYITTGYNAISLTGDIFMNEMLVHFYAFA
jgi:hypothetical protein